eukprot:m.292097 g.292097  ORF g.292097 m.292097 type:complete len:488 (-) comp55107_c0_seq1:148-1611(-)
MRETMTVAAGAPARFVSKRRKTQRPSLLDEDDAVLGEASIFAPPTVPFSSLSPLRSDEDDDTFDFRAWRHPRGPAPAGRAPLPRSPSTFASAQIPGVQPSQLGDSLTSLNWLRTLPSEKVLHRRLPSIDSDDDASHANFFSDHSPLPAIPSAILDWRTSADTKPPFSYVTLIYMAMQARPKDKYTLADIYSYITDMFAYYRHCDPGWKNSVRHNLSQNECFEKITRSECDPGKGGYWRFNPLYRACFVNGIFVKPASKPTTGLSTVNHAAPISRTFGDRKAPSKPSGKKPAKSQSDTKSKKKKSSVVAAPRPARFDDDDDDEEDDFFSGVDESSISEMDWKCLLNAGCPDEVLDCSSVGLIPAAFEANGFGDDEDVVISSDINPVLERKPSELQAFEQAQCLTLPLERAWPFTPPSLASLDNSFTASAVRSGIDFASLLSSSPFLRAAGSTPPVGSSLRESFLPCRRANVELEDDREAPVPRDWLSP